MRPIPMMCITIEPSALCESSVSSIYLEEGFPCPKITLTLLSASRPAAVQILFLEGPLFCTMSESVR